jgi:hypothetical protein
MVILSSLICLLILSLVQCLMVCLGAWSAYSKLSLSLLGWRQLWIHWCYWILSYSAVTKIFPGILVFSWCLMAWSSSLGVLVFLWGCSSCMLLVLMSVFVCWAYTTCSCCTCCSYNGSISVSSLTSSSRYSWGRWIGLIYRSFLCKLVELQILVLLLWIVESSLGVLIIWRGAAIQSPWWLRWCSLVICTWLLCHNFMLLYWLILSE